MITLNVIFSFLIGILVSAFLYGGAFRLSDGLLAVIIGLLIQIIQLLKKKQL